MKPTLMIFNVDAKMKDGEIRDMVTSGFHLSHSSGKGVLLSFDGYNEDPRDLWEIPEAINFAKKLCAMGVMSILTLSTYLDPSWEDSPSHAGKPFGAFELWLLAKELLGQTLENPRLMELFDQFYDVDLPKSNAVVLATRHGLIGDGNHKA